MDLLSREETLAVRGGINQETDEHPWSEDENLPDELIRAEDPWDADSGHPWDD